MVTQLEGAEYLCDRAQYNKLQIFLTFIIQQVFPVSLLLKSPGFFCATHTAVKPFSRNHRQKKG